MCFVQYEKQMSLAHRYRGQTVFIKFYWVKPNDSAPAAVHIVDASDVLGFGITAAELVDGWPDYESALAAAVEAANRFIDSQLG